MSGLKTLNQKFNALVLRERLLVTFSVCAVVYLFFNFMYSLPVANKKKDITSEMEMLDKKINLMMIEKSTLDRFIKNDPNARFTTELHESKKRLKFLDDELAQHSNGFVPAEKMPTILQDILTSMGDLALSSLITLPAIEVKQKRPKATILADQNTSDLPQKNAQSSVALQKLRKPESLRVYRNGVRMKITGSHVSVVQFLAKVENLPWQFYWQYLDTQTAHGEKLIVTVDMYTLSTQKSILGV